MTRLAATTAASQSSAVRSGGWLVTCAFWSALVFAAGTYGIVSLAPKVVALEDLAERHHARQWELVALERRVRSLQKTIEAIDNDPRMARELTRMEFGASDPDEQSIPVEGNLALEVGGAAEATDIPLAEIPARRAAWYVAPLRFLAANRSLENTLLALAAGVAVYAFTFLREPHDERSSVEGPPNSASRAA